MAILLKIATEWADGEDLARHGDNTSPHDNYEGEVTVAEIHTEMIPNAGAPGAHTTTVVVVSQQMPWDGLSAGPNGRWWHRGGLARLRASSVKNATHINSHGHT